MTSHRHTITIEKRPNSTKAPTTSTNCLENLKLLKQYLTFISNEVDNVILSDNKIQLFISDKSDPIQPITQTQKSCRLGATLLEAYIHDQVRCKEEENEIKCICDAPTEEFGEMVQCDDCSYWLHVDCLDLDHEALKKESFCCPRCVYNRRLATMETESQSGESQVTTPVALNLDILSRIAYIDSVRKEIFSPNATDVFLYENESSNIPLLNNLEDPRYTENVIPSDMCSQDLSEYSGPFWDL